MEGAAALASYANAFLFAALATIAAIQWTRQRENANKWFAATFACLALVGIYSIVAADQVSEIGTKFVLTVLVLFPYCLYRFMGTFLHRPLWVKVLAGVLTFGVIGWTLVLPPFPVAPQALRPIHGYYLLGLIVQFALLSLLVTVRLWLAGRGQPSVARARMRFLSLGAFGITAAVVLALSGVSATTADPALELTYQVISLVSMAAFFVGFAPPAWLRVVWRRKESEDLQRAVSGLMASSTPEDVAGKLLPHVVSIIGARGAALLDADGKVIATHGTSIEMLQQLSDASPEALRSARQTARLIVLPFEFGSLIVWASPYTPFFGREEVGLITSLGALTDIAMERAALFRSVEHARVELEELNAALGRREAMLAQAQDISRIGSWEWDVGAGKLECTTQLYRIYGVDPDNFDSTFDSFMELVHPEDTEYVDSIVKQTIGDRAGFHFEYRIVQPSGETRVLETSGRIEGPDPGRPPRVIGVVHDITERKESERALADAFSRERLARVGLEHANQELESFVYSVSHDLNSPLISVLGYIDLLETDHATALPKEARFYLERIQASTSYMQSLIKDLLELSRVGRTQTEAEDVDLDLLIEEVTSEIVATHPSIAVGVSNELPGVHMNPVRARQLFANLIQNSVKYADRPDVRIDVTGERDQNGHVMLSVADNGPGIAEKDRERVFGVFERLESKQEGTGIGLAVCKRIVETSGGRIWIADSASGTDMRLSLPAASNDNVRDGSN